ncbi:hypothetical protein C0J52_18013 [Blattella germanica]|nr:hypothetical protein C0J52_18013 [Blattella germanica]
MDLCSGEIALVLKMFSFFRKKAVRILMGCNPREHCRPLFQELESLQLPLSSFLLISYICSLTMMSETRFLDYTPMTRVTTET